MKKALIFGITGQDGSYLAEFLLGKGYEVHGVIRRSSSFNTGRIEHLYQDPHLPGTRLFNHYGDLSDTVSIRRVLEKVRPDEVYNLGAQTHVRLSFDIPEYTAEITGMGTLRLLEALVDSKLPVRFYQASSSEMFGKVREIPQRETTPFYPRSPYGCAKMFAHWAVVNYREAYNLHASSGILFNHESPRRGEHFVTRKITRAVASILAGKQKDLFLGNLDAKRDWGFTPDYIEAMWLMLQQPTPDDYVIATGETHSVQEFLDEAFGLVGIDWRKHVKEDPKYFRPTEVELLVGDYSKAKRVLGWEPKVKFKELVRLMVEADLILEGFDPKKVIKETTKKTVAPAPRKPSHPPMKKDARIFVAGHRGLVGSAIVRRLKKAGCSNVVSKTREELDLLDTNMVDEFFRREKPEYVFMAAAKVGGIVANDNYPVEFLQENLRIASNVIGAAGKHSVEKLLFLGSSCIYPRMAQQPITESSLLTGALEKTNEAYAIAKIAGLKLTEAFHKQLGKRFISAMPCNLYGEGDNFHPMNSHVIPGMLTKFHDAKQAGAKKVTLWGTGKVRREFLHADDLADALFLVMNEYEDAEHINIGSGIDVTIAELALVVKDVVGFKGQIEYDTSRPDGTPRKLLAVTKLDALGWSPKIKLAAGIRSAYEWALTNQIFEKEKKAA